MNIRRATTDDIEELRQLCFNTIITINKRDYNQEQIKAWASTADKIDSLRRKILEQHFFVSENDDHIITGFASLDKSGYVDMMYVHKDFQNRGIAKQLLQKIIDTAITLHFSRLETDASITAKSFFEKHGFIILRQQTVLINDTVLTNYKMEKIISFFKSHSGL